MVDATVPREEWEMLAAERALGVLEGAEYRRAAALELADSEFAEAVAHWQLRFAPMLSRIAEAEPDAALWDRILARLPEDGRSVVTRLHRWRAATMAAIAVAAVLALVLILRPLPTPGPPIPAPVAPPAVQQPVMVAQLSGDAGDMKVLARYDAQRSTLHLEAANLPAGAKMPELWVIPVDGAPHSLGEAPANGVMAKRVASEMRKYMVTGATLAVTMEAPDTMPHAAPTATPIVTGTIALI